MSARLLLIPALLSATLVLACGDKDDDTTGDGGGGDGGTATDGGGTDGGGTDGGGVPSYDADGDGYHMGIDCDDGDPNVFPGAEERCNGIDDNCDGVTDTDAVDLNWFYQDYDGDGYGNPLNKISSCDARTPSGYVTNALDCRDSDPDINPLGREVCDEQDLDENCDGLREDEDPTADTLSMSTFYADYDLDGFGSASTLVKGCDAGDIRSVNKIDCDDSNPSVGPNSSCAPWDGVWRGAVDLDFSGLYGVSGSCTDTNSLTISDRSSNQVSGTLFCNWYSYGYYALYLTAYGTIDYPWGVSGYFTDPQNYFYSGGEYLNTFTGVFSPDGTTLTITVSGSRSDWSGYYDLELSGTWTLSR